MGRPLRSLLVLAVVFAAACQDQQPITDPAADAQHGRGPSLPVQAAQEAQISTLLNALVEPGSDRAGVMSLFADVKGELASGDTDAARSSMFDLLDLLLSLDLRDPPGPETEAEAFSRLTDLLFDFVGLTPPDVDPDILSGAVDGVVAVADAEEDNTIVTNEQFAGVSISDEALPDDEGDVLITIRRIVDPQLLDPCLPTSLPQAEGCYAFDRAPDGLFAVDVVVGVCLDPNAPGPDDTWQLHKFDPADPGAGVVALPPALAPFLDCAGFQSIALAPGPVRRFARAAWQVLGAPVRALAPARLRASDSGFGGLTGSFSDIGWAKALTVAEESGDDQTGPVGTTLTDPLTVRVTATHFGTSVAPPIPGVDVTFSVTGGGGELDGGVTTKTVQTDGNGEASVDLTLGPTAGVNTVEAEVEDATGSPVVFEATATVGSSISGVVAYSGTPLQGVLVELIPGTDPLASPIAITNTDAGGAYQFTSVAAGTYQVKVNGPTSEFVDWVARTVNVVSSDITEDFDLPKEIALQSPSNDAFVPTQNPLLEWEANPQAATYTVQVNVTNPWTLVEQTAGITTNSYTVATALTAGETYTWQVDAYDSQGRWVGSTEFAFEFTVVSGNGLGTATIDGVNSPGEWDLARTFDVFTNDGDLSQSTLYVMNDGANLYLGLHVTDGLSSDDRFEARFDNTNDEVDTDGDDNLSLDGDGDFSDAHFDSGFGYGLADASSHGAGAVGAISASEAFFEISHPLDSGDGEDLSVGGGDVFGLCIRFFLNGTASTLTTFQEGCVLAVNEQTLYEDVQVAVP